MLCYAMLRYTALRYAMLCYAMLRYAALGQEIDERPTTEGPRLSGTHGYFIHLGGEMDGPPKVPDFRGPKSTSYV